VLTIKGKHHYLRRAVEQNGHVLDILMQSRRNRQAVKRFFRKRFSRARVEVIRWSVLPKKVDFERAMLMLTIE